jgi:hypothetical protein
LIGLRPEREMIVRSRRLLNVGQRPLKLDVRCLRMKCHTHRQTDATAQCRICSLFLCDECAVVASQGFVCSQACLERSDTYDRIWVLQKANLSARHKSKAFIGAALLVVIGFLLVAEHALFGSPAAIPKVVLGVILMFVGVAYGLKILYVLMHDRAAPNQRLERPVTPKNDAP